LDMERNASVIRGIGIRGVLDMLLLAGELMKIGYCHHANISFLQKILFMQLLLKLELETPLLNFLHIFESDSNCPKDMRKHFVNF
jgi:hypothetical protein